MSGESTEERASQGLAEKPSNNAGDRKPQDGKHAYSDYRPTPPLLDLFFLVLGHAGIVAGRASGRLRTSVSLTNTPLWLLILVKKSQVSGGLEIP